MINTPHHPLIAVTGRTSRTADNVRGPAYSSGHDYAQALARAGAQPVVVPPVPATFSRLAAVLSRFDGVVLHGGGDIDPRRYGEEPSAEALYGIVPEHDDLEFALVTAALARDLPVFAICRGMQVLNVALGGTLHQDLGTEDHWFTHHPVDLVPGSLVAKAVGSDRPDACPSVHHQALKDVAGALDVVGRAPDGTVEAVELSGARWVVGVQWHPEDTAATDPAQQALFDDFVRAAGQGAGAAVRVGERRRGRGR